MSVLGKSLGLITIADLESLVSSGTRENSELEFKGTLPFVPQKGQPQTTDRWIEKGDRIGDYARDEILSEIVAFANAEGGTLIIGLHESNEEPRQATRLQPLPNCEGLTRRLLDSSEDIIEPRLSALTGRALPIDSKGNGYVLLRAAKSVTGPHRLKSTREFYVRRGERAAKMDVREIKDLTLTNARAAGHIDRALRDRSAAVAEIFREESALPSRGGPGPLAIRASAMPMAPVVIPEVTSRHDLWWVTTNNLDVAVNTENYPCPYPFRGFAGAPEIRLRSLISSNNRGAAGVQRVLRGDGLVESCLIRPARDPERCSGIGNRVHIGWMIGLIAATIAQVDKLRTILAWDSIEFGLEVEIFGSFPLMVFWDDTGWPDGFEIKSHLPLLLPKYSLISSLPYDSVIEALVRDVFNSCGEQFQSAIRVPWTTLGVSTPQVQQA